MPSGGRQVGSLDERESRPGPPSPTRSGDVVRNSSSTTPASRRLPNVCGPASQRIRRWPRARSASTTATGSICGSRPEGDHGRRGRQVPGEPIRPGLARQDECSGLEQRMFRIDRAVSREDGDLGCRRCPESFAKRRVVGRGGRVDPLRQPGAAWACAQHAGRDEHGVGERTEQPHEEAIGVTAAGDELVRPRHGRDRHDAVDGRDEVRVEARLGEAEVAAVEAREVGRKTRLGQPLDLVQELQRLESTCVRHRTRAYAPAPEPDQGWKRSPSTTLSTTLRSARKAIPTRSSSSSGTAATAARFASSWPVSNRSAV